MLQAGQENKVRRMMWSHKSRLFLLKMLLSSPENKMKSHSRSPSFLVSARGRSCRKVVEEEKSRTGKEKGEN